MGFLMGITWKEILLPYMYEIHQQRMDSGVADMNEDGAFPYEGMTHTMSFQQA